MRTMVCSQSDSMIYPKIKIDDTHGMEFRRGPVKFFSESKGFGFIQRPNDTDLFFHASDYRNVTLDTENYRLKLSSPEPERAVVEVKRKLFTFIDDNLYDYLDIDDDPNFQPPPKTTMESRWIIKPTRLPLPNDIVCYTVIDRKSKPQAGVWFFANDYPIEEMRQELNRAYKIHFDAVINLPLYKLERRTIRYGEPRADNAKKCFIKPVEGQDFKVLFHGTNVAYLNQVLEYYKKYNDAPSRNTEVTYTCFKEEANGTSSVVEIPSN